MYVETRRRPALDGMRAIAIAGVFLLHLDRPLVPGGAFGVDVFFVLSSFLITGLLLQERQSTGGVRFGDFYWRRFFRLVPALVAWVLLATVTALIQHVPVTKIAWSATGSLFYFSDFQEAYTTHVAAVFDQSWSLGVEEQFYFLWPVVLVFGVLFLKRTSQRPALTVLVTAAFLLTFVTSNYFLPTGHLLPLAMGAWAAEQVDRGVSPLVRRVVQMPGFAVGSVLLFAVAAETEGRVAHSDLIVDLVAAVAGLLVISLVLLPRSIGGKILGHPIVTWVGLRSYGIYLYGLTLLGLVPAITHLRLTYAAPVDVIFTLLVVSVSYTFLERPVRARGRSWLDRKRVHGSDAAPSLASRVAG